MNKNTIPYTSLNRYFLIPFFIWIVAGGLSLIFFDRQILFAIVNTHHTSFLDISMYYITKMGEFIFIAIVSLVLLSLKDFRNWQYVIVALSANVISAVFTQWMKSAINAPRPLNYFKNADWIHYMPEWDRLMERSFPSGHTCGAFALFCFVSFLLKPKYLKFAILFFMLAMLVGYSRLYLAAHFFLDIYVGSIIGAFFSILVLFIMRKIPFFHHKDELGNQIS